MSLVNHFKLFVVFLSNSLHSHLAVIAKVLSYLFIASLPFILIAISCLILYWKRAVIFIKEQLSKASLHFTILVGLPAFLFYIAIYFMKPGYLLNILPG